ncbi:MAG: methyltransferase domain-containing protein [Acidimicrobiia bacterium]
MTESGSRYVLADEADDAERARLDVLEAYYDPITQRHLERIGVGEGWRCLEVAAGGGSIARWLAERVGSSGSVVATDMNTRFLTGLPDNVEVRRHDIQTDDLEADYDLVHCRGLLMHLPDPGAALSRMVSALRPGGWALVDEVDFGLHTVSGHPEAAWATGTWQRFLTALAEAKVMDAYVGRKLPGLVAEAGLDSLGGEAVSTFATQGAGSEWDVIRLSLQALRPATAAAGMSEAEYDRMAGIMSDPSVMWIGISAASAWGRQPG